MIDQGAYVPLCDVEGCRQPAGAEPVEVRLKTKFPSIELTVRVYPCQACTAKIVRLT